MDPRPLRAALLACNRCAAAKPRAKKTLALAAEFPCKSSLQPLSRALPNFARACGRVSVGGHPDKRPDSRLRKNLLPCTRDRQPEAKTGAPRSPRGTRLKATTERAFLVTTESCRSPKRLVLP